MRFPSEQDQAKRRSAEAFFEDGGLLIASFPSIGLQALQRLAWLGLRFLARGVLGRARLGG